MTVARHDHRAREHEALLAQDLVGDSTAGRVELDAVLTREVLDTPVLAEILLALVLDVVVHREDRLARVADARGADRTELRHHGRRVVVCHHVHRAHGEEVAGADELRPPVDREIDGVGLRDLLDEILSQGSVPACAMVGL